MSEFETYAPGTPSWVDLASTDADRAKEFYSGLFGWSASDPGPDAGGYAMFTLRGEERGRHHAHDG